MARRGKSSRTVQRGATATASRWRLRAPSYRPRSPLILIEDRRTWNPVRRPFTRPQTFFERSAANLVLRDRDESFRRRDVLAFQVPKKVAVCVRRKQRRETLFALNRTGAGARSRKHRNYWSNVAC